VKLTQIGEILANVTERAPEETAPTEATTGGIETETGTGTEIEIAGNVEDRGRPTTARPAATSKPTPIPLVATIGLEKGKTDIRARPGVTKGNGTETEIEETDPAETREERPKRGRHAEIGIYLTITGEAADADQENGIHSQLMHEKSHHRRRRRNPRQI